MEKPIVIEVHTDNGDHSHWALINPETGDKLWSESPEECKAMGYPTESGEGEKKCLRCQRDLFPQEIDDKICIDCWQKHVNV